MSDYCRESFNVLVHQLLAVFQVNFQAQKKEKCVNSFFFEALEFFRTMIQQKSIPILSFQSVVE